MNNLDDLQIMGALTTKSAPAGEPVDLDALEAMLDEKRLAASGPAERFMRAMIAELRTHRSMPSDAALLRQAVEALQATRLFIEDEYGSPEAQAMHGEFLAKPARSIHGKLCAVIAAIDARKP